MRYSCTDCRRIGRLCHHRPGDVSGVDLATERALRLLADAGMIAPATASSRRSTVR